MKNSMISAAALLSDKGPFHKHLNGFKSRAGQQQMSAVIEQAIARNQSVAIEVAAGSGKTLAYLVAALNSNKKTIISTASHQLQHQLFYQDIPLVQRALGSSKKIAMLKGRSNYLCPYYLNKNLDADISGKGLKSQLSRISGQYTRTGQGELGYYDIDNAHIKQLVTASAEECLGSACPQYRRCPWVHAGQQFREADIAVVNHSLLLTDKLLDREPGTELKNRIATIIVDEAHRLVDFAGHLVPGINSWKLTRFCHDARLAITTDAQEQAQLTDYIKRFEAVIAQLKVTSNLSPDYVAKEHIAVLELLCRWWQPLRVSLQRLSPRSQQFNELAIRSVLIQDVLQEITDTNGLCWFEQRDGGFILHQVPLSVAALVSKVFVRSQATWVFTSATLAIAGSPERFLNRIGQGSIPFHCIDSDLDYAANALLYTPVLQCEPNDSAYLKLLVDHLIPVLQQVPGRSLLLFTSHRALQIVAGLLTRREQVDCFVQGTTNNNRLIEQFKVSRRGVLLATGSFWEGLDLADTALAFVCIDRLPFASPEDPLVKLRSEVLFNNGMNNFQQDQLADAVIRLRQGCGRLLRRLEDRGVIMLADPRLQSRDYGKAFMHSLPAMRQVRSFAEVANFFNSEALST